MSSSFESEEQVLYDSILAESKTTVSQVSLDNVRAACKKLLEMGAPISITKVAGYIEDVDNLASLSQINGRTPPKKQSISNNKKLRGLVALYQNEQEKSKAPAKRDSGTKSKYPTADLDNKTKVYINLLRAQVSALKQENKSISQMLKSASEKSPVDLSLSYAASERAGSSSLALSHSESKSVEDSIFTTLLSLPSEHPEFFKIKSRNGRTALFLYSPSGSARVLSAEQWDFLIKRTKS